MVGLGRPATTRLDQSLEELDYLFGPPFSRSFRRIRRDPRPGGEKLLQCFGRDTPSRALTSETHINRAKSPATNMRKHDFIVDDEPTGYVCNGEKRGGY